MILWRLVLRTLSFYRRLLLPVLLTSVLCAMVITGALLVGDSIRASLSRILSLRLGRVTVSVKSTHLFSPSLADRLSPSPGEAPPAALLSLRGIVSQAGGARRVGDVQILGVDDRFLALAPLPGGVSFGIEDGNRGALPEALINPLLAKALRIKPTDEVMLRVERTTLIPMDLSLSPKKSPSVTLRVKVREILSDDAFGRFSLYSDQVVRPLLLLKRNHLAKILGREDAANLMLSEAPLDGGELQSAVTLDDLNLTLAELPGGGWQLESPSVFISDAVAEAAESVLGRGESMITGFVNRMEAGGKSCPYSFASTASLGLPSRGEGEVDIAQWLATNLSLARGDRLSFTGYRFARLRKLEEETITLRVRLVIPQDELVKNHRLTPVYPGITGVESCTDWDSDLPIDLTQIRPEDEAYWSEHRELPKAFLSSVDAERFWANPYGRLTALRWPKIRGERRELERRLARAIPVEARGFEVTPVSDRGAAESAAGVDFSGLFFGLSLFLIVSTLLLTGLLFSFQLESRKRETGILRTMGFSVEALRFRLLLEGVLIAALGSLLGAGAGILYCEGVISLLSGIFKGAVTGAPLVVRLRGELMLLGGGASFLITGITIYLYTRTLALRPFSSLVRELPRHRQRGRHTLLISAALCTVAALLLLFSVSPEEGMAVAGRFFVGGGLLLLAGVLGAGVVATFFSHRLSSCGFGWGGLFLAPLRLRPARSLSVISAVALGVFLVVAVSANRHGSGAPPHERRSGTGGFSWMGESVLPINHDLTTAKGRSYFGFPPLPEGPSFVQISVRDGDDASCLNLNRITTPRLLGVVPEELDLRSAFTFHSTLPRGEANPWLLLRRTLGERIIPAIADEAVIQWGLGLSLGDEISVHDERGEPFTLRLVAALDPSIFQGSVIVSKESLERFYPSLSGSRMLLVDPLTGGRVPPREELEERLFEPGVTFQSTKERLASFLEVQNTYLSVFLLLGGLGVVMGTFGLGAVCARSVLERQAELAVLRAVGLTRGQLILVLLAEHGILLLAGTALGTLASLVAVLPALLTSPQLFPFGSVAGFLVLQLSSGVLSTLIASLLTLPPRLNLTALRAER